MASVKIGAPVTPRRTGRPFRVSPSRRAGLEKLTKGRVSSRDHRFTLKRRPSVDEPMGQ